MTKISIVTRRHVLIGSAAAVGSALLGAAASSQAATNAALRGALKYQDTPKDGVQCTGCVQWVPGKTPQDKGSCKIIPGDTEISPTGWCSAFIKKP